MAARNGLDTAIRALAIARRTVANLRLDLQGVGDQLPRLKELAVDLGVRDAVFFWDLCPVEKVVDFILHGDVGIIPYRYTGFSEYYAWMHRPIIASDTIAIRSMFRPESVVRCDPESPEGFAEAMVDLYRHPAKRARMVAAAAEDYVAYRWEVMATRYQDLLGCLCRG
jgi:glycosyltransferase involved in cell wall biosynthesis